MADTGTLYPVLTPSGKRQLPPILREWFSEPHQSRRILWGWLEPEACRLAACYWWPTQPLSDLQSSMRLHASLMVRRPHANGLDPRPTEPEALHALALEVLDEAIAGMGASHNESFGVLRDTALSALRNGGKRRQVFEAAIAAARERLPLPPPWLVEGAVEQAARNHRYERKAWRAVG